MQSEKEDKKKEEVVEEVVEPAPIKRIIKMNLSEWPYLAAGTVAAMGNGAFPLVFALLLSEVLNVSTAVITNNTPLIVPIIEQGT